MTGNSLITTNDLKRVPGRRSALQTLLGVAGVLAAQHLFRLTPVQAGVQAAPHTHRLALLIGNGDYPVPHDLPPIQKNVMDLGEALSLRGFDVTQAMNLDENGLQTTVKEFVKRVEQAPADAVTLFYYAGHGLQFDSNNLLLGSGANPTAPRLDLLARSLVLQQQLLAALPPRPQALNITVIDACRTDLRNALGDGEGLNQVEAPLGCLVCFSTGAGKPAVSPSSADHNTFFTGALVKQLRELPGHITFNDLFRMVKDDVEKTMLNHPLAAIRRLAQTPFIADNAHVQVPLSVAFALPGEPALQAMLPEESAAWKAIESTQWPVDLLRLCQSFLKSFPNSIQASLVQVYQTGAQQALKVLRNQDVKLFKTSFVLPESLTALQQTDSGADLVRAARGDKDAAARIARLYREQDTGRGQLRYVGWLQYAGGLGNGIATYELALYYRKAAQPLLAAQAEAQARQLGYSPPRALGHARK